jgi:hypothetical protein
MVGTFRQLIIEKWMYFLFIRKNMVDGADGEPQEDYVYLHHGRLMPVHSVH